MKLTKQEQAVAIGTFISMLGQDLVNERIDKEKLKEYFLSLMKCKITQHQSKREAMISLLGKAVDEFLEK